jgi:proteasome assembly chaperone (PAC2) family protein
VDYISVERRPELHDPVAVIAFAGWNDAASAATNAARFVIRRLGARRFANVDPEPFYVFSDTRPLVRLDATGQREIIWPDNGFFFARNPIGPHDVIVAVGVEPNLRWRDFTEAYRDLFTGLGISMIISLGALMAGVPHTRPVRVNGTAIDPDVAAKLSLTTSRYEGPTGIVGVLHDTLRRSGVPAVSLWANVPHYVTTAQNPLASAALLRRLQPLLGLEFDFTELDAAGERFVAEVNTAVSGNPDIAHYIQQLETAIDSGAAPPDAGLPSGEALLSDIEEFLRSQRDDS